MKKKYLKIILILTIASSLTACSTHSGNIRATDQTVTDKIKIGKTTKDDVRNLLGETQNVLSEGTGKDVWIYQYSQTDLKAKAFIPFLNLVGEAPDQTTLSTLTIMYTQDGIVENVINRKNTK